MNRDTRVIGTAVCVGCAALLCTTLLLQATKQERRSLALTADLDLADLPPEIALAQVALGSFRGLFNDVLWARAHQLERAGRFHEAMQIARWICKLQPYVAEVWTFCAHNAAYNLSVATHTTEERWYWVDHGVRILRDEALAIPRNRSSPTLHVGLSRIYADKLADNLDDYHWHYKQQLAREWHVLLGPPPLDGEHVSWLEPIASAPATLVALTADPEVGRQLRRLRAAGYGTDRRLLTDLVELRFQSSTAAVDVPVTPRRRARVTPLAQWLGSGSAAHAAIVAFTRARLVRAQRLDPQRMIALTRASGPLDWRHPSTHSLYWATEGLRHQTDTSEQRYWTLQRMLLMAAKQLVLRGDVVFDYVSGRIRHLPDPRFFVNYERRTAAALAAVPAEYEGVRDSFREGRKHFRMYATLCAFDYGDEAQARRIYASLRREYPDSPRFQVPLREFLDDLIKRQLLGGEVTLPMARQAIGGLLRQAIERGLACRKPAVFRGYVGRARRVRAAIVRLANHIDENNMPSLETQLDDEYCNYMRGPLPLYARARIYRLTPRDLRQRTYDRWVPDVAPLYLGAGLDVKKALPR